MAPQEINEITEHFLNEKRNGKDFSGIKKELVTYNLNEDEIKEVLKEIDRHIFHEEINAINKSGAYEIILIGLALIIVGLVITFGTLFGLFNTGSSFIVMYGPIIGGAGILLSGLRKNRRHRVSATSIKDGYFRKRT
uniref:hypothetical protein n=1 Tax=uncultured Draconibacterium sp. TaxID=1573823 RepID=UPI003216D0D1